MRKIVYLMGLMVVLLMGVVYGASTFTSPLDNAVIGGLHMFAVTTDFVGNSTHNCTVTGSSAITSDTLATTYLYNDSVAGVARANNTIDTGPLLDVGDWTFGGYCYNSTYNVTNQEGRSTITAVTGVTVDNTVPVCSQSTLASSTEYDPEETSSVAVTVTNSTSCWAIWDSNYYSGSEDTSEVCTFTIQGIIADQIYKTVTFYSKDGLNETTCTALSEVQIKSVKPKGWVAEEEQKQKETLGLATPTSDDSDKSSIFVILVIAIVVIAIITSQKNK